MAFDQHSLGPVSFGLRVDTTEWVTFGKRLANAPRELASLIERAIHTAGEAVYGVAFRNLSGDAQARGLSTRAYKAMGVKPTGGRGGAVLNVRSGRLRGALVKLLARLRATIENDVFYGVLWEQGFARKDGRVMQRPWMEPAFQEAVGGQYGFGRRIEQVVADWVRGGLGHA